MKRNDDLLRELLFRLEAEDDYLSVAFGITGSSSDKERAEYGHLLLLADAGFVELTGKHSNVVRLTNAGHDFLSAVRLDTTWNQTKKMASDAGLGTVKVLFDIAVAIGKKKLKDVIGVDF